MVFRIVKQITVNRTDNRRILEEVKVSLKTHFSVFQTLFIIGSLSALCNMVKVMCSDITFGRVKKWENY